MTLPAGEVCGIRRQVQATATVATSRAEEPPLAASDPRARPIQSHGSVPWVGIPILPNLEGKGQAWAEASELDQDLDGVGNVGWVLRAPGESCSSAIGDSKEAMAGELVHRELEAILNQPSRRRAAHSGS
jgi:hypothetical protein